MTPEALERLRVMANTGYFHSMPQRLADLRALLAAYTAMESRVKSLELSVAEWQGVHDELRAQVDAARAKCKQACRQLAGGCDTQSETERHQARKLARDILRAMDEAKARRG